MPEYCFEMCATRTKPDLGTLDAFEVQVKHAIELTHDPAALGAQSLLAQPYFLGPTSGEASAQARGEALTKMLRDAVNDLPVEENRRLLHAYAFARELVPSRRAPHHPVPRHNNTEIGRRMGISERTLYRERDAALKQVAAHLLMRSRPAVPLPMHGKHGHIVERAGLIQIIQTALASGGGLSITGNSGVGKTTLVRQIADDYALIFWHTLYPGLNDSIGALVFSLGRFFLQHNAPHTWRQWMASQARPEFEVLMLAIRQDLAVLASTPLLFVFDETDMLVADHTGHTALKRLIEAMISLAPVVVIGQRAVVATRSHLDIDGLNQNEYEQWLIAADLNWLNSEQRRALHAATRGSPGLLGLYASLKLHGGEISRLLLQPHEAPSADVIFERICRRLDAPKLMLLEQLALAHAPLPRAALQNASLPADELLAHQLIVETGDGALSLAPFVRRPAQLRALRHAPADTHHILAGLFESLGATTSAMYHWVEAGKPEFALWLWQRREVTDINRGMTAAAYEQLRRIRDDAFHKQDDRTLWMTLTGRLAMLQGHYDDAIAVLDRVDVAQSIPIVTEALHALGVAYHHLGQGERSIATQRQALQMLEVMHDAQRVRIRHTLSYTLEQTRVDRAAAELEANKALHEAYVLKSETAVLAGRHEEAGDFLGRALAISSGATGFEREEAMARSAFGNLLWRLGRTAEAINELDRAVFLHRLRGSARGEANDRNTLAAALLVAGDHIGAIREASAAYNIAAQLKLSLLLAVSAANVAEAHLNLGDLSAALSWVNRSLAQEEDRYRAFALSLLGQILRERGDAAGAREAFESALEFATSFDQPYDQAVAARELGRLLLQLDERKRASQLLQQARRQFAEMAMEIDASQIDVMLSNMAAQTATTT